MSNEYSRAVAQISEYVLNEARRSAAKLSGALGAPESKVLADVLDQVQEIRPVGVQLERDKRAGYWRVRLRLFRNGSGELEADSDPEVAADAPGTTVVRGLPGVAEWAGDLLRYFHESRGETAQWLDHATIQKKLKSLRPTLSRKHGKTTWRIEYQVDNQTWRALIDIEREPA